MIVSIFCFCLSTYLSVNPVIDPASSREWVDNAAAAAMMGRFPSGSRETLNIADNASKEVSETISCLEKLAVMVEGGEIRDGDDGSNDGSGVGGTTSSLS